MLFLKIDERDARGQKNCSTTLLNQDVKFKLSRYKSNLSTLGIKELQDQATEWETRLQTTGQRLAGKLRARDRLKRQQKRLCAAFTVLLRHISKLI